MFVMSTKPELVITVPLVLFGLFRYWFVVEALDAESRPQTHCSWTGSCCSPY